MKNFFRNRFLILGLVVAIFISAITGLTINKYKLDGTSLSKKTHEVILTKDGFSPSEITIQKGDTIEFITSKGEAFWPASNLHPTHGIYPEFDPKEPIEADKGWSFTFERSGIFKYHDHLSPIYKGKITVGEAKLKSSKNPCQDDKAKLKCYEDLIDSTLLKRGLKEAFDTLANLFQTDPEFVPFCHDFTHKLGEKAYLLFSEKKDFSLTEKSSYCGYGFYHGFMETLLQKTANMGEARRFCEYADATLKQTTSDALGACYHGIGHGAVDGSDPRTWGDPKAMIKKALALCDLVSNDETPPPRYGKLYRCASGVFNGLEILSSTNKYKLSVNKDDPFWVCKTLPDRYKESCFTQFVVAVMNITGNDFNNSAKIIDTIAEDNYAIPSLQALVVEFVHLGKTSHEQTISFCRGLPNRFQMPCISAFGEGFLKYGPPEKEYVEAVNFCSSSLLVDNEKSACFKRVLSLLRIWYTADKSRTICQEVEQRYRWQNCQYY